MLATQEMEFMSVLLGKTVWVCGIANEKSIAAAIAKAMHAAGAKVILGCMPSLVRRVQRIAAEIGNAPVVTLDVRDDQSIAAAVEKVSAECGGKLDALVHSIAYADIADLGGEFIVVSRQGWQTAMDISAYSLVALSRAARPLLKASGSASVITITFIGSRGVAPGYNVMGVAKAALEATTRYLAYDLGPEGTRVNAISAGPVETPSSMVIEDFQVSRNRVASHAPLLRNVEATDVAGTAVYLASGLSSGITGSVISVDAGIHALVPACHTHRAFRSPEKG